MSTTTHRSVDSDCDFNHDYAAAGHRLNPSSGTAGTMGTIGGLGFAEGDNTCGATSFPTGLLNVGSCTVASGIVHGAFTINTSASVGPYDVKSQSHNSV